MLRFIKGCVLFISCCGLFLGCAGSEEGQVEAPQFNFPEGAMPEFVSVPAGSFIMGDQAASGEADERPAHNVKLNTFLISKFEVTWQQYAFFAAATERPLPADQGWGRERRPAINVSWNDALAYTNWLSDKTDDVYRLPTEQEWEYAARAGAVTLYVSGNDPLSVCGFANIADQSTVAAGLGWNVITECNDGVANQTASVGSYSPNHFGLYDVHGNVWEWVSDCYRDSYDRSVLNVLPRGSCATRVIRGGSFKQSAMSARLSNRESLAEDDANDQVGFRIVKER